MDRQTDAQNERYVGDSEKEKPIERGTEKQKDRHIQKLKDWETVRKISHSTERQTNRQTDKK